MKSQKMELKKYTTKELKKEIESRQELESFNKWNKIPNNVIDVEEIRSKGDGTTLFYCHVDDGMESHPYFIEAKVNAHSDEDIAKIVQKKYIVDSGGEDRMFMGGCPMIFGISVEEIGRYGYTLLKVTDGKEG